MSGDTDIFLEDIELIIYPETLCKSCQISLMNKNARSKNLLNPKAPFQWIFMDIITSTEPKRLTSDTNVSDYL